MTSRPAAPHPPTPYHHGDLRSALVEGAFDRVREHGADAVSLRSVATAAGVSPSAAYHHFPDKTALLVAVGERINRDFDRAMGEAWTSVTGDDDAATLARFEALGRAYIGFALAQPHLFRHQFGPVCAGSGAADEIGWAGEVPTVEREDAFGLLLRILLDLGVRGLLRGDDVEGLSLLVWSTVHGFATLAVEGFLPPDAATTLFAAIRTTVIAAPDRAS